MDPNKPEPAPHGTGREITPLVMKDLELRSKMGKEKYGEALRAFNGRNALVDAYQEALDLVQYLRQRIEEQAQQPFLEYAPFKQRDIEDYVPVYTPRAMTAREAIVAAQMTDAGMGAGLAESIAQEAHRLVLGERGEAYGHPIFDMTRSADMLTALLRDKLRPGARLEAEDIAQAMMCVKQSRERNRHKRDNQTDTAGYALTKEMIGEWRAANPGVDPRDVFPAA